MKTMKKFWKYFLNFIVLFLLVTGLTFWGTTIYNKKEEEANTPAQYIAQESSPAIEIKECTNKKITGTATNDMNVLLNVIYIKADFYDKDEKLLGTEYDEIKYFNVGEKAKFEIKFNYKNVSKVEITGVESK